MSILIKPTKHDWKVNLDIAGDTLNWIYFVTLTKALHIYIDIDRKDLFHIIVELSPS